MTSPLAKQLPQQLLQQLPAWLLQLLSGAEWRSLMRLSIFPAGFSLRDAAHVLPSAGILYHCSVAHAQHLGFHDSSCVNSTESSMASWVALVVE